MRLSEITVYAVKSARGTSVRQAVVEPWGLAHDRRWMIVDGRGEKINAQRHRQIMAITALPSDAGLELRASGKASLAVAMPTVADAVPVTLSRVGYALSAGSVADEWLSAVLGMPVRLVWLDDPRRRSVSAEHGGKRGDTLSLADTGPLLLASRSSMTQLNSWIAATALQSGEAAPEPLSITRFRPNVVVEGDLPPFAEDRWSRVRIGQVEFRTSEQCDRCATTTIEPDTLASGKEPIRTLAVHRKRDGQTWFGVRLVPLSTGAIRVGDPITTWDVLNK